MELRRNSILRRLSLVERPTSGQPGCGSHWQVLGKQRVASKHGLTAKRYDLLLLRGISEPPRQPSGNFGDLCRSERAPRPNSRSRTRSTARPAVDPPRPCKQPSSAGRTSDHSASVRRGREAGVLQPFVAGDGKARLSRFATVAKARDGKDATREALVRNVLNEERTERRGD